MRDFEGLPGADLVLRGLEDLSRKSLSAEALTLSTASTRLRRLGIELPEEETFPADRELALYALLCADGKEDPYFRFNSMRRALDSFVEALEARRRRKENAGEPRS
jgi:hypothetical protein